MALFTGTTPTYVLTFGDDVDLTQADAIAVTITDFQRKPLVELTTDDLIITETTIQFTLSQEQTLALPNGNCLLQVNAIYDDGTSVARACSEIGVLEFKKNLKNEVME